MPSCKTYYVTSREVIVLGEAYTLLLNHVHFLLFGMFILLLITFTIGALLLFYYFIICVFNSLYYNNSTRYDNINLFFL